MSGTMRKYINELRVQRNLLVNALKEKGVEASGTEKFNTLIPKIADISGGGGDGFVNFTATAKTIKFSKASVTAEMTYPVINASVTVSLKEE